MGQTEQEQQNALTKKKRPKMSRVPSRSGSKLSGRSRTKTGSIAPTEKSGVSLPTRSNNTHWQTKLCLADTAVPSKSGVTGSRRGTTSASRSSRKSRTRSMSEFKSYVNGGSQFVGLGGSSKSAITRPGQTKSWGAVTRSNSKLGQTKSWAPVTRSNQTKSWAPMSKSFDLEAQVEEAKEEKCCCPVWAIILLVLLGIFLLVALIYYTNQDEKLATSSSSSTSSRRLCGHQAVPPRLNWTTQL